MITRLFILIGVSLFLPKAIAGETIFSQAGIKSSTRVVVASDSTATVALQPQPAKVRELVNRGIFHFTEKTNLPLAWRTIVASNDVVGIKVYSTPGANSGTRPSVAASIIEGLLESGVPATNIIIWDKDLVQLRLAGFDDLVEKYKIRIAASSTSGYDEKNFYESPLIGNLVWGDSEFGKKETGAGRKSFVTKLVIDEITKIISVVPLLNHNLAGTTGHLFNIASGGVDNIQRFDKPDRLAIALPEIYALESLGDKVVLNITDALLCQYQGEQRSLLHYSAALNQIWFSKDPVALDVMAINELQRQREMAGIPSKKKDLEIYDNAALLELGQSDPKLIAIENAP